MRLAVSLLFSALFAACLSAGEAAVASFPTQSAALEHVRACVRRGDAEISLQVAGNAPAVARYIADALTGDSVLAGVKTVTTGNCITLAPEYAEDFLLLRAATVPAAAGKLSVPQKQALAKARNIVAKVCAEYASDYDRARALHDYLVINSAYAVSPKAKSLSEAVSFILNDRRGVCEGYARAYGLLLSLAGIENRFVGGTAGNGPHAWNLVRLGGQWVHVDCTYDDPLPDVPGRVVYPYFAMSDAQIGATHRWNRTSVPAATTNALYYPVKSGMRFATVLDLVRYCAAHRMPKGYVTAYVDELGEKRTSLAALLESAQRQIGKQVVLKYTEPAALPCVFCFVACP